MYLDWNGIAGVGRYAIFQAGEAAHFLNFVESKVNNYVANQTGEAQHYANYLMSSTTNSLETTAQNAFNTAVADKIIPPAMAGIAVLGGLYLLSQNKGLSRGIGRGLGAGAKLAGSIAAKRLGA